MIKTYIIPQLSAIKIDNEISLRLTTAPDPSPSGTEVLEPGNGSAGLGGQGNGSNEGGWNRAGGVGNPSKDPFGSGIWE